ncbi:MAG TPA: 4-hydroxy-tetrahydrodipicolinate reductase [Opitutales bacterium]|nr:4-hydroxy-tetrahydrodipicolinate reductase [Opitutales bacterium]
MRILIHGASGRMGKAVIEATQDHPEFEITAKVDADDDIRSVIEDCDAAIDFSSPEGTITFARAAASFGKAMVIGTTGHTPEQKKLVNEILWNVPTVWSGNFSIGVNLLFYLTQKAAEVLGDGFDPEIMEMHHRMKKDSPSGTADRLLEILMKARRLKRENVTHGREGMVGKRPDNEIGVHALRGGDVIGEHTVIFSGIGEQIELKHKASSRAVFAEGALRAAKWAVSKRPGLYDMQDVLGLRP